MLTRKYIEGVKGCYVCKRIMPVTNFYLEKPRYSSKCRDCMKDRKGSHGQKERISYSKEYRKNNPLKMRAKDMVRYAIQKGKLVRGPCVKCGETKVHGHHEDYSRPLDVIWLCSKHHMELHAKYKRSEFGYVVIEPTPPLV